MATTVEMPFMMGYMREFTIPKAGGKYDPKLQVRVVKLAKGQEIPFVQTGEMSGMGSTKTGERAGEH